MKLVLVRVIIGTGKDQRGYLCVVMQMFYLQCHAADSTEATKDKMQQENALFEFLFFHTRDSEQHFPTGTKGGDSQFLQVLVCECQECLEVNLEAATSQFNNLNLETSNKYVKTNGHVHNILPAMQAAIFDVRMQFHSLLRKN